MLVAHRCSSAARRISAAALDGLSSGTAGRVRTFIGPSGVGKSSFVRAALLPRLASHLDNFGSLQIAPPMRPRTTPLRGLAASLRGFAPAAKGVRALEADLADPLGLHYAILDRTPGGETLVLLVDQLEEALSAARDERDTFLCAPPGSSRGSGQPTPGHSHPALRLPHCLPRTAVPSRAVARRIASARRSRSRRTSPCHCPSGRASRGRDRRCVRRGSPRRYR